MKDESKLDELLAARLRAQGARPAGDCPPAEIVAAYVEQVLAPGERARWETHFASCNRCQEQIAALVRLSEDDEPLERPVPARRRVPGLRWAWAASVLVAVTVAGLWYTGEFKSRVAQHVEAPVSTPAPAAAPQKTESAPQAPAVAK